MAVADILPVTAEVLLDRSPCSPNSWEQIEWVSLPAFHAAPLGWDTTRLTASHGQTAARRDAQNEQRGVLPRTRAGLRICGPGAFS